MIISFTDITIIISFRIFQRSKCPMSDYRFDTRVPSPCEFGDLDEDFVSGDNMAESPGVGEEEEFIGDEEEEEMDVYAQLEQKEKDLRLAAELGKALLEKNEELERRNEQIIEEFSQKLEVRSSSWLLSIWIYCCVILLFSYNAYHFIDFFLFVCKQHLLPCVFIF